MNLGNDATLRNKNEVLTIMLTVLFSLLLPFGFRRNAFYCKTRIFFDNVTVNTPGAKVLVVDDTILPQ